ncbi:hypothetical protein LCGC14_0597180 [marine sediment metagenome]|uniref:Uncharacterized protein n=1 Tax=marine sediment metagenome TaxID=412755 RepID=A0A0F9RBQ1_9ZZZZ
MGRTRDWPGDYGRIKAGSSKKIGKNYVVMLSRPVGVWDKLRIIVRNDKTKEIKTTKFIPIDRAIKYYKKLNSVKEIKGIFKI